MNYDLLFVHIQSLETPEHVV